MSTVNNIWVISMQNLLKTVPEVNMKVMKLLFDLVSKIVAASDVNLMTAKNMAIVLGPNLLKNPAANNPFAVIQDMALVNSIVCKIIDNIDALFGSR